MAYCNNCGKELNGEMKFCPHCGSPVEKHEKTQNEKQYVMVKYINVRIVGKYWNLLRRFVLRVVMRLGVQKQVLPLENFLCDCQPRKMMREKSG